MVVDEAQLLLDLLDPPVGVPRIVFDPEDDQGVDAVVSELRQQQLPRRRLNACVGSKTSSPAAASRSSTSLTLRPTVPPRELAGDLTYLRSACPGPTAQVCTVTLPALRPGESAGGRSQLMTHTTGFLALTSTSPYWHPSLNPEEDLRRLARALAPDRVVPIHSLGGESFGTIRNAVDVRPDGQSGGGAATQDRTGVRAIDRGTAGGQEQRTARDPAGRARRSQPRNRMYDSGCVGMRGDCRG